MNAWFQIVNVESCHRSSGWSAAFSFIAASAPATRMESEMLYRSPLMSW